MANKAGIIPSGNEGDMVARIAMEAAKGNEALARLYIQMLNRYQERLESQEFRREERDVGRQHQREMMHEREDLIRGRNKPDPNAPNPMGSPGAGGDPRRTTTPPAAAPAQAPATPPPPAYRPMPTLKGSDTIPGTQQFTPQGSDSKKFSQGPSDARLAQLASIDANAQAPPGAGHTEFSAQSRVNPTAPGGAATRPRTTLRPPEQLPRAPSRKTQMAEFLPIRREWLDLMTAEEKKHKLPPGSLLVTYGMENGGGKVFGNDPNKAYGLFQWTKRLRDENGISDADAMNPAVMIPATAANMRKNANEYKRVTKSDLPATNEYMPFWVMLHQWGIGDGPRMVYAALKDAGHMPAATVMLTNPGGKERNNNVVLSQNGVGSNATIKDVVQNATTRSAPYHNAALRIIGDPDAYSAEDGTVASRPPGGIPMRGAEGLNPAFQQRLQALIDKAPPEIRNQIRVGSGYRSVEHQRELWDRAVRRYGSPAAARRWVAPPGGSEHGRRNAADLVYDSPEARKWVHANAPSVGLKFPMSHEPWHIEVSETRGGPQFTGQLPTRVASTAATAPAAAPTAPPAAAQAPRPAAYVRTPAEGEGKKPPDPRLFSMFGVPQSPPLVDEVPRSPTNINAGQTVPRPIPRASELARAPAVQGPQQAAMPAAPAAIPPAAWQGPMQDMTGMPGAPELPNLPPAIEETIPSSIQRPPPQPAIDPDAAISAPAASEVGPPASTADWSAPSSIPSIRMGGSPDEQIARNMQAANAPPPQGVRWWGSPDEQVQRNMLPSWEYPDDASQPAEQQAASPIPSISMSGDPYSAATQKAAAAQAGQEFPFPDDVAPNTQAQAQTPEDVIVAQTQREVSPQRPNAVDTEADAHVKTIPTVDETNWMQDPGSRASREYRSGQRGQFISDTIAKTPAALAAIRDAIFKGGTLNVEGYPPTQTSTDTGHSVNIGAIGEALSTGNPFDPDMPGRTQRGAAEAWRIIQESLAAGKGTSTPTQVPSGAPQMPSGVQSRIQSIVDAIKEKGEEYRNRGYYAPKSVKTINPVAPDAASTKPNAAKPAATGPKDEPIVLTPRPNTAYVPFSNPPGTTPQSTPQAVPMPRPKGATTTPPANAAAGGVKFERVGPGQFIAVPVDADKQPEAEAEPQ